jgi:kynurenine formamidase
MECSREEWHMIAHNGTHMDAPIHYVEGGRAMNGYDVRELIVPAVVIDIHERAAKDRDTQLQVEDIKNWESRNGRLPRRVAVLMYSGWDRKATEDPRASSAWTIPASLIFLHSLRRLSSSW